MNYTKQQILDAVNTASNKWKQGFNTQNPVQCVDQYEDDAVMDARPFGQFIGRESILAFWTNLINDGFADVDYIDPIIEVNEKDGTALLKSKWKMNKVSGVIHKELWVMQNDGTAKLREDDFEASV